MQNSTFRTEVLKGLQVPLCRLTTLRHTHWQGHRKQSICNSKALRPLGQARNPESGTGRALLVM